MVQKRASMVYVQAAMERDDSQEIPLQLTPSMKHVLTSARLKVLKQNAKELKKPAKLMKQIRNYFPETDHGVSIRISNLTYTAKKDPSQHEIQTVYNQSVLYDAWTFLKRLVGKAEKPKQGTQNVLNDISLNFVPGKMYLILGPPASGKTSLLKAVAGRLSTAHGETIQGEVKYNGLCLEGEKNLHVQNFISYVGQLDFHAPRLTVKETFDFAFQCKSGGTHIPKELIVSEDARKFVKKLDEEDALPKNIMEHLGLEHVANTFVGNGEIRGVSGGQRRRVTVGEMIVSPTPIFCGDEISNGLDAESTYNIVSSLMYFAHVMNRTRVISLLQPSPEAVSLFDEIILLAEGQIIFAGPVDHVEGTLFFNLGHFLSL
jgi:ABC-type multidrug transport system ATPase subunit